MPSFFQIFVCTQVSCALVDVALLHHSLSKRDCENVWAFKHTLRPRSETYASNIKDGIAFEVQKADFEHYCDQRK
jgi:hypothetical protein